MIPSERLAADHGGAEDFWQRMAALGLLGIGIDEAHGGSGGDFHDHALVLEALDRRLVRVPYMPTVILGAGLISAAGSDAQKSEQLPKIVAGECKLAFAHAEGPSFEPPDHIETRAVAADGGSRLTGAKRVVFGSDDADIFIVSALTSDDDGSAGLSLFLVPAAAEGLTIRGFPMVDGTGAADINLEGIVVDGDALLGPAGGAAALVVHAIDRAAAALCCAAVGSMAALNALTLDYLKTRVQFGRPIGKFQVLQHRMVDMAIAEDMARSMAIYAAEGADAADPAIRAKSVSAAKSKIGEAARTIGQGAIQLHGGIGVTEEYSAGRYFKRLTAFEMSFGSSDDHLDRYAALD